MGCASRAEGSVVSPPANNGASGARQYTVGVDIGGTFTDCIVVDPAGTITTGKVPTTPHDRSEGFFASIARAAELIGIGELELIKQSRLIVHGTTTGTNAIVSRSGATVGLLCTAGHEDIMHLMNGGGRTSGLPADELLDVPSTYKPEPLVPKSRVAQVQERIDVDGEVVVALNEGQASEAVRALVDQGADAIAVSLLWSVKNPRSEQRVRELVAGIAPDVFVSCGKDLISRVGEYQRTTSAVMNAYIGPLMVRYIDAIEEGLVARGFEGRALFAQSAGGAITGAEAKSAPIRTVDSGPVAGVVSSKLLSERIGEPNVIAADMGGTTFDVSVIHNGTPLEREVSVLQRYELALPMVDIESVGAGGGSIAWIDESGRLNVGPQSAGADPGPASYGRGGTEATVTDADVVLGIIRPQAFLDGRMQLDASLAEEAIGRLADRLGMSIPATAAGINRIVDARMADLIRRMSVMRGLDPREFVCFAYGGGGPVHAAAVARETGIRRVVVPIPRVGALWSALGAAAADVTHHYQEARVVDMPADPVPIAAAMARLENQARTTLADEGFGDLPINVRRSARMKFTMQVHDVEVPFPSGTDIDAQAIADLGRAFESSYEALFGKGSGYSEGGVQITSLQVRATAELPAVPFAESTGTPNTERSTRPVYWTETGGFVDTTVITLAHGALPAEAFEGPLLLEFPDTVVVIRPGMRAHFDEHANVIIDISPAAEER